MSAAARSRRSIRSTRRISTSSRSRGDSRPTRSNLAPNTRVEGPIQSITIGTLGGGTNWPGASYDPENHVVYAQAANAGVSLLAVRNHPALRGLNIPKTRQQGSVGLMVN